MKNKAKLHKGNLQAPKLADIIKSPNSRTAENRPKFGEFTERPKLPKCLRPPDNIGRQGTFALKSHDSANFSLDNQVGLDWLKFSVPNMYFDVVEEFMGFNLIDLSMGGPRDKKKHSAYIYPGIQIMTDFEYRDQIASGRFLVEFSGSGLGWVAHNLNLTPTLILAKFLQIRDVRVNRLDIAFDHFIDEFTVFDCARHASKKAITTKWRKGQHINGFALSGDAEKLGETLYLGQRGSKSFCRIYDKMAERANAGYEVPAHIETWVRVELQVNDHKQATQLCREFVFLPIAKRSTLLASYLRGKLEFKELSGNKLIKRRPVVGWWDQFLGDCGKHTIRIPKEPKTLEDTHDWFKGSMSATLATLHQGFGDEAIYDLIQEGREKMTTLQKVMAHGS